MAEFSHHSSCDLCGSKDNRANYKDSSWYCFGCSKGKPSEEWLEENSDTYKKRSGVKQRIKVKEDMEDTTEKKSQKPVIDPEKALEIKSETSTNSQGFRGITQETSVYFGVRYSSDEATGEVIEQYYPCTQDGQLTGYKVREVPKNFYSIGRTGADCELFGQFRFNRGGKYVIITEGELCQLSAYQMMKDYAKVKGGEYEVAVVSPTIGSNATKQIAAQYKFLDSFDNIILAYDSDEAGQKAQEKVLTVLPKGKVKLMALRFKDHNEYLEKDQQRAYMNDFYSAKLYTPDGIIASNQLSSLMREELMIPKIPLPPFMHKLQEMMAGGIPLGRIINLGSASGTGKSTILDEMIYYWLFNSPHLPGIVSLESSAGQYGLKLLSRHVSNKIELMDNDNAISFIDSPDIQEKEFNLFNKEDGRPRFYLMDERDGGVESLKDIVENLVISFGVKVIVLDPLQDILGSLAQDDQESFLKWQKGLVKSHHMTFCNVNHVRKNSGGQKANSAGADIFEEDFHGSSSIFKSGACNLLFTRNKEAEDDIERNTTTMKASKIRWTGFTGQAGQYYYDNKTHTMHDLDDWREQNGVTEF